LGTFVSTFVVVVGFCLMYIFIARINYTTLQEIIVIEEDLRYEGTEVQELVTEQQARVRVKLKKKDKQGSRSKQKKNKC